MARRRGGIHKCVEEKRRMLPIYQHYTLSPGKTKSHHPQAKCIHCLKEFVCGSKQRLIRHLRKCNSITNPEQIIAETLNTLARNSATGQLNHSILEASNLIPSHRSANQKTVGHTLQYNYHPSPHQNDLNNNHSSTTSSSSSTTRAVGPYTAPITPNVAQLCPTGPIDKAYLKLVIKRNLPISLCDTKEFHNWVKTFANDYKPPSSINLIAQNLKQEAQAARQRVSNILVKAPKKTVNLELQYWPDHLRGHSWYAIIASLDSRRFLISIKDVTNDGEVLTDFIDDCIKRVGSDRVNSLIFTGKKITELARAIYSNHPSIVTYHCWWHFTLALLHKPTPDTNLKTSSVISANLSNHLSLSDYMNWFLIYGKSLFDSWTQSPDRFKYNLLGQYIRKFDTSLEDFKLLFAAYLLNPKYRCAYVTQKAKDLAIEEILNIASEFMPEESDGHTIFDQWKLYLVREEPYDMVIDESRSAALDWWMSLPCAESIRRVALRILRLKAFSSTKLESLFSQLYVYEDETKTSLNKASYEDWSILRFFYDQEDRLSSPNSTSSVAGASAGNLLVQNSVLDQTQANNDLAHDLTKYLSSSGGSDGHSSQFHNDTMSVNDSGELRFLTDAVDYMDAPRIDGQLDSAVASFTLENLPGFEHFVSLIDFNEVGIRTIEEPIEKKRRKWTAQEILSRCQSSHNKSNGTPSNDTADNKINDK